MKTKDEISLIAGGLAGLIAAIDLSKRNFSVLLFEKITKFYTKDCDFW